MLNQICQEWDTALQNAVSVEDRMASDGQTFEYRKSSVRFRGVDIEVIAKRRPSSGLLKDGELDPSKGPSYLVTIFVPSTGKFVESIPSNTMCPKTEKVIMILEALGAVDRDALVAERVKAYNETLVNRTVTQWEKEFADTAYTPEERNIFLEHAKTLASRNLVKYRADTFIKIVSKYSNYIIGKDLDFINPKLSYSFTDVMFNLVCQLLSEKRLNTHKDVYIPTNIINNRFWNQNNPEWEAKMPTYIRHCRSVFREIYADCGERPAVLGFVLLGLAKYYEYITGESVELRTARENERRKNRTNDNRAPRAHRMETKNLVNMSDIMKGIKI